MCLILHALGGGDAMRAALDPDNLRAAWKGNPHGAGIAYKAIGPGSRVRIVRGLMSAADLVAAARALARSVRPYEVAVHLRYATHGANDETMTHPFPTAWGALVHNWILRGPGLVARGAESDTAAAARIVGRMDAVDASLLIGAAWLNGSRVLLMRHGARSLRVGRWVRGVVDGLTLSQSYSLPMLVAPAPASAASGKGASASASGKGGASVPWWETEEAAGCATAADAAAIERAASDALLADARHAGRRGRRGELDAMGGWDAPRS